MIKKIEVEQIPFDVLGKYGLSREQIEDLPNHALEGICAGRRSPVLPMSVERPDGETITFNARFALVFKESNDIEVMFYPVPEEAPLSLYSEQEQAVLKDGNIIIKEKNGKKEYVQFDKAANQVFTSSADIIMENIAIFVAGLPITAAERETLERGETVTITLDDDQMTVGVDLNSSIGLRYCRGTQRAWKETPDAIWNEYSFGLNGCWHRSSDGRLDYISEDNYSEELWKEMQLAGQRNMRGGRHR